MTATLEEILITPSNEIKTDRFANTAEDEAATCSGKCASGQCRSS